jgi:hypothetical protein
MALILLVGSLGVEQEFADVAYAEGVVSLVSYIDKQPQDFGALYGSFSFDSSLLKEMQMRIRFVKRTKKMRVLTSGV